MKTLSPRVYDFLPDFIRSLEGVRGCEFLEIAVPPSMEHRPGATAEMQELVAEARRLQGPDDSFTETLMTLAAKKGQSDAVLHVAQYHQPLADALVEHRLTSDQLTSHALEALGSNLAPDRMLVVTSRVTTSEGIRHIPLADFKLAACDENTRSVQAAANRLGDGVVLISGSSYHFYGRQLLTTEGLIEWLLRAQLLSRYIDTRWITHQLIERRCALRISRGGGRDEVPQILR